MCRNNSLPFQVCSFEFYQQSAFVQSIDVIQYEGLNNFCKLESFY